MSEAMPAVHVTPIPVDAKPLPVEVTPIPVEVTPIPADAEDTGGNAHRPSDQDTPQSALKENAREDEAAQDAGESDTAEAAGTNDAAQGDAPAPKSPDADTTTVALTVVEAKTT
jgi:hypothetical protein